MKTNIVLILWLLLLGSTASAQHWRRQPREKPPLFPDSLLPKPGWLVSTNLQSLIIEGDAGPNLSVEYRIARRWSVVLETMLVLYRGIIPENQPRHGFRIQPEVRHYFPGLRKSFRGFIGMQGAYKYVKYSREIAAQTIIDPTGQPIYREKVAYTDTKNVTSLAGTIGFQLRFGRRRHLLFECYGGLGAKHRQFKNTLPVAAGNPRASSTYDLAYTPHIPAGAKFGFCF